jgi:hypothetical protein
VTVLVVKLEDVKDDKQILPQCQATARGTFTWIEPHQCPFAGRYIRKGFHLCGNHAFRARVEIWMSEVISFPLRRTG